MFRKIDVLDTERIATLQKIAANGKFVDGKISNPHSKVKNNLQLHDMEAYQQSAKILHEALVTQPEFNEFAFPAKLAPPMMTRYQPEMNYGLHTDSPLIPLPDGPIRADLSCTIFLSDPATYDGGALHIRFGDTSIRLKEAPGTAVVYPSNTLHEVEPVTSGERLVAITFIESRIGNTEKRNLLYELNEVSALEGLNMKPENFTRIQAVQSNLMRFWMAES